jgi:hypothetical protein
MALESGLDTATADDKTDAAYVAGALAAVQTLCATQVRHLHATAFCLWALGHVVGSDFRHRTLKTTCAAGHAGRRVGVLQSNRDARGCVGFCVCCSKKHLLRFS